MSELHDPRDLRIADYTYALPDERIARYPLPERDAAKLLVYHGGKIEEDTFRRLPLYLPEGATLVLNTAKVVNARLLFQKPAGGTIEIFCLEAHPQYADISTAMARTGEVLWQCLVGGAAKWKPDTTLSLTAGALTVEANLIARNDGDFTIHFTWTPAHYSFAQVLAEAGKVPLPPYLSREAEQIDEGRYQTLFAQHEGSVAAPTASLHFTPGVLDALQMMGICTAKVTLHVSAGTFMPVKSDTAGGHRMHEEWIEISADTITQLLAAGAGPIIAGGTTALRTLESLYCIGCAIAKDPDIGIEELPVGQWCSYEPGYDIPAADSLEAVLGWLQRAGLHKLVTRTAILIAPGYRFRIVDGLITNFHQPQSTLLLLVAALIGEDWKKVYDYALQHSFRFLSYGDGSLLWRKK